MAMCGLGPASRVNKKCSRSAVFTDQFNVLGLAFASGLVCVTDAQRR